jgi:hypothetical protein
VLRIRDILVERIRICGSVPLANGSGFGSDSGFGYHGSVPLAKGSGFGSDIGLGSAMDSDPALDSDPTPDLAPDPGIFVNDLQEKKS